MRTKLRSTGNCSCYMLLLHIMRVVKNTCKRINYKDERAPEDCIGLLLNSK